MTRERYILVLADDLSGACDTGVQFADAGRRTRVHLHAGDPAIGRGSADVTVVDCDTRHRRDAEAYAIVGDVLRRCSPAVPGELFVKIDSTLRGPIGGTVRAALDAFPAARALVAPAFPRQRRVTRHGIQLVDGIPVDQSAAGFDPRAPVRTSRIADVMADIIAETERVHVMDAATDRDLERIVRRGDPGGFWVGSAGLAQALAERERTDGPAAAAPRIGPCVVVAGTVHPTTQRQLAVLAERGVTVERLDPDALIGGAANVIAARERLAGAVAAGRTAAVALDGTRADLDHDRLLEALAAFVVALGTPSGLTYVLTGGETARAVCTALGIRTLLPVAQVEAGIPLSRAGERECLVLTKSGGFGTPETIARIARARSGTYG